MANTLPALTSADLWPLLPELVLAVSAFALLLFDLFFDGRQRGWTQLLSMLALMVVGMLAATGIGAHGMVMHEMFVRDGLSDLAKGVICFASAATLAYGFDYLKERGSYKGEVPVLVLFATLGMMLMCSSANLVMLYVGLEMLALCSYALVALERVGWHLHSTLHAA